MNRCNGALWTPGLVIAFLVLPAGAQTTGATADGFEYSDSGGAVTITGYTGVGGAVTIPGTIVGDPVTTIGFEAFADSNLTGVTIPTSVTSIESLAFTDCFYLPSITIPGSVTSIGPGAFDACTAMTAIAVDPSNATFSSDGVALFDKAQTQLLEYPGGRVGSYTIPSGVTTIGSSAFADCHFLTAVTIPTSVTTISGDAFESCFELGTVSIPSSVTSIGPTAFIGCLSMTAIIVDPSNPDYSSDGVALFDEAKTQLLVCPAGAAGSYTIPASVAGIADNAFQDCEFLTSITIPGSVENIGLDAFADCSQLTSIAIPSGVVSVGVGAFDGCRKLTLIAVDPNNAYYSSDGVALFNKAQTQLISYPNGRSGSYAIPSSVLIIGDYAFSGCNGLSGVTIPGGVTSIGVDTFFACNGLTSITIPGSVTNIGSGAFFGCSNLTQITFLGNAPATGSQAFQGVNSSAAITYPAGATGWTNPFAGLPANPTGPTPTPTASPTPSPSPTPTPTSTPTPTPTPTITPTPTPSTARLINISTRAQVGAGGNILIPGFVISGSGTETLLIRGDGPGLTQFGVAGVLAQPSLTVINQSSGATVASNTGWGTGPNPAQVASVAAQVGAFSLASGSADCAVIVSLPAGAYTVELSGVGNTTGVALAEVYEVSSSGTRLVNISTRAQVGTGGNIMIAGFVVTGSGTEQLLVRGDGPSLTQFGVAGVLAQPNLSLINQASGATVASNTGWGTSANPSLIANVEATVGAFALVSGSADSAVVANLTAGAYTAQISGVNNTTGVVLAEVYEVP
jgi:hypothetical protein